MSSPDVAGELVDALLRRGVDTVYGIGGTHTLQLLGAIERSTMHYVPARTEVGAMYMAIGHARATGRVAVALTSTGPGALNATSALADAQWSCTPVIHLTTQIGGAAFAGAVHETASQTTILQCAGKDLVVLDLDDVDASVERALHVCDQRPAGPVTLVVESGNWNRPTRHRPDAARSASVDERAPVLDQFRTSVDEAQRPVVFVGGGALKNDNGAAARALAEHLGAPIITSYQGRTVASWGHPLYLGPWATEEAVRELCSQADLTIVLGSKLSSLGTGGWLLPLAPATYAVGIGHAAHGAYAGVLPIDADASAVAAALTADSPSRDAWAPTLAVRASVWDRVRSNAPGELAFLQALEAADRHIDFVADMTKAGFWAMKYLSAPPGAVQAFSSYMAMGSALPMAIGMATASRRPVTALIGDGALQMSLAELATLGDIRPSVNVLVVVDHAYGILRDNSLAIGGSRSLGLQLWNPDLVAMGHAFGLEVDEIHSSDEAVQVLAEPNSEPRLVLVHQPFSRAW
jgi:acetolactate synthase-1/2/3 large subunit